MKFNFPNNDGETLSGKLELPEGEVKGYALFAHCFTCSKNIVAPRIISRQLTENGIGVLRFDFTGLGNSDGDFSNTNFSSNVGDLLSACQHLSKEFEPPKLLIGHSLGGAAVLKAAASLPHVKAVVTIGAPSDTKHVKHLFHEDLDTIESEGKAEVTLEGRNFTIKKQFIDDLKEIEILRDVEGFKKALLVMHSPIDNTVSIDHAAKIFLAAKHPRSFLSLDDANHLLMDKEDAQYAARVIGPWALRYFN